MKMIKLQLIPKHINGSHGNFGGKSKLPIKFWEFLTHTLNNIKMESSDDDVPIENKEYIVYYHGNDPAPSSSNVIDVTKDEETASSEITHISETEMDVDDGKSDTSGMYT